MNKKSIFKKNLRFAVPLLSLAIFLFSCKHNAPDFILIDDDDAVEVNFEDVATDISVVPLESDEALPKFSSIQSYDKEMIFANDNGSSLYYFIDNKFISKLNAVGRGPGEYLALGVYFYCPKEKMLYVKTTGVGNFSQSIMCYSVPDMKFKGKIPITGQIQYFTEYDENSFLAALTTNGADSCSISIIDKKRGNIIKKVQDINWFAYRSSYETMSCYNINNRAYAISCYNNSIGTINKDGEFVSSLETNFGSKNLPKEVLDFDPSYFSANLLALLDYIKKNEETLLIGCLFPVINGNAISFWYEKANNQDYYYYRYKNGCDAHYKGFHIKGFNGLLKPIGVKDDFYFAIVEGGIDKYKNKDEEPSKIAERIFDAMYQQKDENPVIVIFRLK